ncbi:MAG: recombinase family protein [bacterium]|nr:recombinase family protein [bacterium]
MKRVGCLYRVSTKKQVSDEDDIPMQKQACYEFAERNGWIIVKEFFEKGISGYKLSLQERDVLQELKDSALRKEFDILLVFMFDRLGRREDETPFVVEWFVQHGVEVWSVKEGQQRFDNHVDKLMNYIRFWQANGESEKTSERVKTRLAQLTAEGKFTGGTIPFGYKLVPTGEISRKGRAVRQVVIDEEEAEIVRKIFDLAANKGYGSHKISGYLNRNGYRTHNGAEFQCNTINRILKNKLYCGYFCSKDIVSPKQEYLEIIDEDTFDQVQEILEQRSRKNAEKSHIAKTTKGISLLSGNIFCGHCGAHLAATRGTYRKKIINGVPEREYRRLYVCYHRSRRLNNCDGQSAYQAEKIESIVLERLNNYFNKINNKPKDEALKTKYEKHIQSERKKIKELKLVIKDLEKQKSKLTVEIGKSLIGESVFTQEMLRQSIENVDQQLKESNKAFSDMDNEVRNVEDLLSKIDFYYDQLIEWSKGFDKRTTEEKKMIICQLFKRIVVKKGYEIDIELNEVYEQFL